MCVLRVREPFSMKYRLREVETEVSVLLFWGGGGKTLSGDVVAGPWFTRLTFLLSYESVFGSCALCFRGSWRWATGAVGG